MYIYLLHRRSYSIRTHIYCTEEATEMTAKYLQNKKMFLIISENNRTLLQ